MNWTLAILTFLMALPAWAGSKQSECQMNLVSIRSDRIWLEDLPPVRSVVLKPRPVDFDISNEEVELAEETAKLRNLPAEDVLFENLMAGTSEEAARAARAKILAALNRAGVLVKVGRIDHAIELLDDDRLLAGSGFTRPRDPEHATVDPDLVGGLSEREFSSDWKFHTPPRVAPRFKKIFFPNPPKLRGNIVRLGWAKKIWIRIAAEELGHVAQLLGQVSSPDQGLISQMMRNDRGPIRHLVARESERLNSIRKTDFMSLIFGSRYVAYSMEADVYAFMIETFGHEFIPWWVGKDSGYDPRIYVDQELTRQGIPDREWLKDWE